MTLKLQLVKEICLVLRIKRSESKLCFLLLGRCPCLVVTEGFWFYSWHCILDGHFSHIFVVKIVIFIETTKINEKEAGDGPFL